MKLEAFRRWFGVVAAGAVMLVPASAAAQEFVEGKGEAAGTIGWMGIEGVDGSTHPAFGGSAGAVVSENVKIFAEYFRNPLGSGFGVSAKADNFGGGFRYHFGQSGSRIRPFVVVAGGLHRESASGSGLSISKSGAYAGGGGGVSIYAGSRWGIRPEARWNRMQAAKERVGNEEFDPSGNFLQVTVGVFYRFGR